MRQDEIKREQNKEFFLKCQFAARFCFNRAEILNIFVWLFCIISGLTLFIPGTHSWLILGIPLVLDIVSYCLERAFEKHIATGAKLRNYFDCNVLGINNSKYSEASTREIKEIVEKISTKHLSECALQISHTGQDTPPGVLNWYEFSRDFCDDEVQYECQRINCWWSKKLSKRRIALFAIGALAVVLIIIVVCSYFNLRQCLLRIILSLALPTKLIERFFRHYACHKISLKIEGACELLEKSKTTEGIKELQLMIEQRRQIPVLEVNQIHKRKAKQLSENYEKISS